MKEMDYSNSLKVASVVWDENLSNEIDCIKTLLEEIERTLYLCEKNLVNLVVFPPFIGSLFKTSDYFLERVLHLSLKYRIYLCPGSFYEKKNEETFHTSCLLKNGEILLWQRQLYRAKWECELGLSQGTDISNIFIEGIQVSIILSTDVFYPQVSRYTALAGADLVLSPTAVIGRHKPHRSDSIRGLWQNVQSNLFFGIESGYKGTFKGNVFSSHSAIHAPLVLTEQEDGFLAHERTLRSDEEKCLIIAEININERKRALEKTYNPLSQLNRKAYTNIFKKGLR